MRWLALAWNRYFAMRIWSFVRRYSAEGRAHHAREVLNVQAAKSFWAQHQLSIETGGPEVADMVHCTCGWHGIEALAAGHLENANIQRRIARERLKAVGT